MNQSIFRKYDIRGVVGKDFAAKDVKKIVRGIASHLLSLTPPLDTMVVGMDGRVSSPKIQEAVIDALVGMGINVIDIGLCPTPLLSLVLYTTDVTSGIMITASHNPPEYNGIKIFHALAPVWGHQIEQIGALVQAEAFCNPHRGKGTVTEHDAIATYAAWMYRSFPHLVGSSIKVAFDCGNGASGAIMPLLIETMQWKNAKLINADVDGNFPNHSPDPTRAKNMHQLATFVTKHKMQLGIGFDGDADRMAPLAKNGMPVPGDQVLTLFAKKILETYQGAAVIYDVKGSSLVPQVIESAGGKAVMSATGHACIRERMEREEAVLGGEMSGHFFFKDRSYGYDDGIYAAFRLIELLQFRNLTLDELLKELPTRVSTEEIKLPCAQNSAEIIVAVKTELEQSASSIITIDGVRAEMEHGWGLVRASNTEPHLSIRCEADTKEHLEEIKEQFKKALHTHFERTVLDEHFAKS